jgi:hypothetical protein
LDRDQKFGGWEIGPLAFFKFQTIDNSPGGINPATGLAWTCAQLAIAKLPTCGKDVNIGAGLLIGYDFGPVELKFIYANAFYSGDTVGSNTGSEFFPNTRPQDLETCHVGDWRQDADSIQ